MSGGGRGVISMKWFGLLIVRSVRLLLDIPITGFDNNWLLSIILRRKMLLNDPHYQLLFLCVVSRKTRTKELFVTNSGLNEWKFRRQFISGEI